MAITGLRHTGNFAADERPKNWREMILRLYPNGKAPLTALTSAMKTRRTDDPEFYWWEKGMQTRRVALSANISTLDTSISVTSGARAFKEGDVFWVEQTGEIVYVSSDPASDTRLQVIRGYGDTTATAVTYAGAGVNPNLLCIGSAYEEGSLAPTGVGFDPVKKYNNTQIFRSTIEATRTAMKTRLRTGDQVREAKRECLELHSVDMERAFWLGRRSESMKNGKPIRTTGGVMSFIPTENIIDAGAGDYAGGITPDLYDALMLQIFRYGSTEKMVFGGNRALLTLNQLVRKWGITRYAVGKDTREFGMNVTRFTTPFGEIVFRAHPLFNQTGGGVTGGTAYYGMDSWAFVLDMDQLEYVPFTDADTKYQPELQANGMDGAKSGYLTEAGLALGNASTHFLIKNLVLAAGDE